MTPANARKAALGVSAQLDAQSIPHAFIGGLAVNWYGVPRDCDDIDVLVPAGSNPSVGSPSASLDIYECDAKLIAPFGLRLRSSQLPIVTFPGLVYLKLVSWREKDRRDLLRLFVEHGPRWADGVVAFEGATKRMLFRTAAVESTQWR